MIILSVVAVLLLIAKETLPLFQKPQAKIISQFSLDADHGDMVLAIGIDDYHETGFWLSRQNECVFFRLPEGTPFDAQPILPPAGGQPKLNT